MKKFMVAFMMAVVMVMSVMAMGPREAFAAMPKDDEVQALFTECSEQEIADALKTVYKNEYDKELLSLDVVATIYGDKMVVFYVAMDSESHVESETEVMSVSEWNDFVAALRNYVKVAELSDWM